MLGPCTRKYQVSSCSTKNSEQGELILHYCFIQKSATVAIAGHRVPHQLIEQQKCLWFAQSYFHPAQ